MGWLAGMGIWRGSLVPRQCLGQHLGMQPQFPLLAGDDGCGGEAGALPARETEAQGSIGLCMGAQPPGDFKVTLAVILESGCSISRGGVQGLTSACLSQAQRIQAS